MRERKRREEDMGWEGRCQDRRGKRYRIGQCTRKETIPKEEDGKGKQSERTGEREWGRKGKEES